MSYLMNPLIQILIFPGFLFIFVFSLLFGWLDRKLIARFQGRVGPPFLQPIADLIKLLGKEDILPEGANHWVAALLPLLSFSSVVTAGFMLPLLSLPTSSFEGDFIVVVFLLSAPSLFYFLAGWSTGGEYSILGANRSLLQYFSYEVLFFLALSGTAIASGSWSLTGITLDQVNGNPYVFPQFFGFLLAFFGLIGKLKREPYDIPKAKSEVIVGPLTEFSGKKLALWHLAIQFQSVVGLSLMACCFFGGSWLLGGVSGFVLFFVVLFFMQFALSAVSAMFARLRIDQLINLNWQVLIPLSLVHIFMVVIL
ncbi:MAG: NADH-quinone oxidoreductase subunit H [Chloroflexi bacterium]|nr:NADH-quinone oxidoreductase subunit H [Chloroflexota bacterium]